MLNNIRNPFKRSSNQHTQDISGTESETVPEPAQIPDQPQRAFDLDLDISPDDPLLEHFIKSPGVVEIDKLTYKSKALDALRQAGVKITVPLVSQGELIGLLNLGPRLSEQDYSADDRRLLNTLSTQAAPALRVAQLARQQQQEARRRERIEQELRIARVIQESFLPNELPSLDHWQLAAHWQPARAVSGDFYDFIQFPDGKLGIVTGDVTDKGVPAAMVMASTRSVLRATAERYVSPGKVLERSNDLICPDMPRNMFVTCLYAVLDPTSGTLTYANAGHNLPYKRTEDGILELCATGMPLGLLPGMKYEENTDVIQQGETVIMYSDGLIEAHDPRGEMFGFPKLRELMMGNPGGAGLIELLLAELTGFTGPDWEQEDDVTLLVLQRCADDAFPPMFSQAEQDEVSNRRLVAYFSIPSQPGNERQAMQLVADAVLQVGFPERRVEQLKTAVAETTMNAMEHGNQYREDLMAEIKVYASQDQLSIFITDFGGGRNIPEDVIPDLDAKIEGLQSPRGWGLFLIQNMVDDLKIYTDEKHHTVELVFNLEE